MAALTHTSRPGLGSDGGDGLESEAVIWLDSDGGDGLESEVVIWLDSNWLAGSVLGGQYSGAILILMS